MMAMRWLVLFLVACNGSSSTDGGTNADSGMMPADSGMSADDASPDSGLISDSGGPITCVVPKGGTTCDGHTWECDETTDCNTGACCLKIDGNKNVTGSTCMAFCNDPKLQLCAAMAECSGGMGCTQTTCSGYVVKTCGGVPAAQCK